ncbi:MAG: hypothetical protein AVDCRST_MAG88-4188, partial [uncultured Thermomicrobiales bacterium]
EDVAERFALAIDEPFYDTLGGYVFGQLGRAPAVGDEVSLRDGRQLRVAEVDGRRVARVLLLPRGDADGGHRAAHDGAPEPILRSSAAASRDR